MTTTLRTGAVPEAPFRLEIEGRHETPWSCTPEHLEALVTGWLLAEGYLEAGDSPPVVQAFEDDGLFGARVSLPPERLARVDVEREHRRVHGCGLLHFVRCDPSRIQTRDAAGQVPSGADFSDLFREIYAAAEQYRDTGGMHSAALSDGTRLYGRVEEVGRHNAVDKVIGRALLDGRRLAELGLVVTSRVSGEIAYKAARAGLGWIATRSVPTTLALAIAGTAGIPIVVRAAGKGAAIYAPGAAVPTPLLGQEARP